MITAGDPTRLGATAEDGGVNFALYSGTAERVELCLFDSDGSERRLELPDVHNDVWHGFVPGLKAGACYGYRVHGQWAPDKGLRHNAAKLLIDPYARQLQGDFTWDDAVFGHTLADTDERDNLDSARFVPKCVVAHTEPSRSRRPLRPWHDTIIYEASVRALTALDRRLGEDARGRFAGAAAPHVVDYLKSLGITALELLPIQAYLDEHFLAQRGLRNAWGYNTVAFFAPMQRFAGDAPLAELRYLVDTLHDANIEVILDVVYNHTAEGDVRGPTISWRGIDNLAYYRVLPENPDHYVNDTGTGNTLNADHPVARQMVIDSLRYWVEQFAIDGFRFDLAPILGRHFSGFDARHPLLSMMTQDSVLRHCKMIAEPWDIGPGGYQLGNFPPGWAEWNDRYRDTVRQYWRGDERQTPGMARRLHGSADVFEHGGRKPAASINFVTAHDGFTLADLVAYERPRNEANGENNLDGHRHNYSSNLGHEGPTEDAVIVARRRKRRLNLLATLMVSQGTPMLLGGDEFGRSQRGNNNAYAQDNEITWFDWGSADQHFLSRVREFIALRRSTPLLRQREYRHGRSVSLSGFRNIEWLSPEGTELQGLDWHHARAISMLIVATANDAPTSPEHAGVVVCLNPTQSAIDFVLPAIATDGDWVVEAYTELEAPSYASKKITVAADSLVVARWPRRESASS